MRYLFYLLLIALVSSCALRYRYDLALQQVPKTATVESITNKYIQYRDTNNIVWLMYYTSDGTVYNLIKD